MTTLIFVFTVEGLIIQPKRINRENQIVDTFFFFKG